MAYLPGAPGFSPRPAAPAVASTRVGKGAQTGIAKTAAGVGKPGREEHLGNLHASGYRAPRSRITGGDPGMHAMGNYSKAAGAGGVSPTDHPGSKMIRGQSGTMRSHIREGGLGPGPMGTPGPSDTNYSQTNWDSE